MVERGGDAHSGRNAKVASVMRAEFTKKTQRQAWDRAGGICEGTGAFYGLCPGVRCTNQVAEYDHVIQAANGGTNDLDNCAAVCKRCHDWKTRTRDTPAAAKAQRQQDNARGIRGPKRQWPKRKFGS